MVTGKSKGQRAKNSYIKLLGFIIILVLINVIAQHLYTRFDFTKEKRYTLNQKTKDVLQKTQKDIIITVFLDGEIPAAFKRLQNATKDLLSDYKAYSNANIKIIFEDPLKDVPANEQDTVINKYLGIGIKPIAINLKNDAGITQKLIFPMALIESGDVQIPVNLLQKTGGAATDYEENITSSIQNLEYAFTSTLKRLLTGVSPKIGFTEGHGEPSNLYLYDAITSLSQQYYVGRVDLKLMTKQGLDDLNVLIIEKPQQALTEVEKYKINYFVMKGGRVVWAIDQVNAELDSLEKRPREMAFNRQLNLDDMLFEYGARINYNLITDVNCAMIPFATGNAGQQAQIDTAPWLYYPVFMPDTTSNVVKNIDGIKSQFASTVDTIGVPNVSKKIILQTSAFNKVFETPKMLSLQMLAVQPAQKEYTSIPKSAAVLLEGSFRSVFLNRPVPEGIMENYNLPAQSRPTKMIVIGDGDVFLNQVSKTDHTPFPLGFDRYTQQNYGNKALLLNIADYFTDDDNLIALRNKEIKVRLLDRTRLRTEKPKWQLVNAVAPILLLICFAIFQHYYRKHKYAK
ncbi:gliding motility-associated ABC transporter substrate-binding protein GldG [Pedobacter frigiditerrae]|uniref:Gliding motility-associated ABC transporter substrate-binding protein GldG n=1 Tax=Pedobacter frigiditerrae TaxID=2530452 RepID=A0A4R0MYV5_9SPHI|nr:gliding motility-associated ABC transporter substrate-binding protein GldG [Pedobacter frigiditerrae]TCC92127.1 gliding motility-associated ABC transporter substrate-binding protein GldG [Pedobacter frigiditerrae]